MDVRLLAKWTDQLVDTGLLGALSIGVSPCTVVLGAS